MAYDFIMDLLGGNPHMWIVFAIVLVGIVAFSFERIAIELTSGAIITSMVILFYLFPVPEAVSPRGVETAELLLGFANPALITIMAMLIIGRAVVQTGALNDVGNFIVHASKSNITLSMGACLLVVMVSSAFMNNTPIVVIFIPIMAALAGKLNLPTSYVMIPLAYASSLGGITTLVGTSTNLLISEKMREMGYADLSFFDFILPGSILAAIGFFYTLFLLPKILPNRNPLSSSFMDGDQDSRSFVAEIRVDKDSELIGNSIEGGKIPDMEDVEVKMLQRGEYAFLPPFEHDLKIHADDIIVITTAKETLMELIQKQSNILLPNFAGEVEEKAKKNPLILAEVLVAPGSSYIGQSLEQLSFHYHTNCIVLGIQRRSQIIRSKMQEIRLQPGDVMLLLGENDDVRAMQNNPEVILLESSAEALPHRSTTFKVNAIFLGVVASAAVGLIPIVIAAMIGATMMVITKCLTTRQAAKAIDMQIVFVIAAAYAMSVAIERTGGAAYIASGMVEAMEGLSPLYIMAGMFFIIMLVNNIISNNASGLLFTPIAMSTAVSIGADPQMFIWATIFASSCAFATPIGYQTNLLVMGPGHYKFADYIRGGMPLNLLLWAGYIAFAALYFD